MLRRHPEPVAKTGWSDAALTVALALCMTHAATAQETLEPLATGVVLNATLVSDGELVYADTASPKAGFWVRVGSLAAWRLLPDTTRQRSIESQPHQQVCSSAGSLACFYDDSSAILTITALSTSLVPQLIRALPIARSLPVEAVPLGAFVNYDLFASASKASVQGAFVDARLFTQQGAGYLRAAAFQTGNARRLSTRIMGWEWDLPEHTTSLTLGGLFGGGSAQRPPVPIIGIRYGSNFALRPDISLAPRPLVPGAVERSSRADLFVDGLFRRSADVPYGPFVMEADSLLAGLGELQTVLTDPRGMQTVQTVRYYFAPQLLPQGLSDFSVEAGALSPDPARLSFSNEPVLSVGVRHGWAEPLTLSATAVITGHTGLAGATADYKPGLFGVLRTGAALLNRGAGTHARWLLGHEYQSRSVSTLLRFETAPGDRPVASSATALPASTGATLPSDKRSFTAAASVSIGERHQLTGTVFDRTGLGGERSRLAQVSASWRPATGVQLSLGVQQVRYPRPGTFILLSLLMPLDAGHLVVVSSTRNDTRTALQWSVQSLPDDSAENNERQYRAFGQIGANANVGASYQRNEANTQWSVEAQSTGDQTSASARLSGALGWLGGHAFATRRIDDSFIVVDSDGQPGLPIFYENRFAGKTNAAGKLLIPGARAYLANQVSLDASALPIEYTLAQDQLAVVPRRNSGAAARFEISDGGVIVPVLRANGEPLPAGARASVSTQSRPAAVGSRSEVFISRAAKPAQVTVAWPDGECRFDYVPDDTRTSNPTSGVQRCQ